MRCGACVRGALLLAVCCCWCSAADTSLHRGMATCRHTTHETCTTSKAGTAAAAQHTAPQTRQHGPARGAAGRAVNELGRSHIHVWHPHRHDCTPVPGSRAEPALMESVMRVHASVSLLRDRRGHGAVCVVMRALAAPCPCGGWATLEDAEDLLTRRRRRRRLRCENELRGKREDRSSSSSQKREPEQQA